MESRCSVSEDLRCSAWIESSSWSCGLVALSVLDPDRDDCANAAPWDPSAHTSNAAIVAAFRKTCATRSVDIIRLPRLPANLGKANLAYGHTPFVGANWGGIRPSGLSSRRYPVTEPVDVILPGNFNR